LLGGVATATSWSVIVCPSGRALQLSVSGQTSSTVFLTVLTTKPKPPSYSFVEVTMVAAFVAWAVAVVVAFMQAQDAKDGSKIADEAMTTVMPWVVLAMGLTAVMFMAAVARAAREGRRNLGRPYD
jgi:hypothetical protein